MVLLWLSYEFRMVFLCFRIIADSSEDFAIAASFFNRCRLRGFLTIRWLAGWFADWLAIWLACLMAGLLPVCRLACLFIAEGTRICIVVTDQWPFMVVSLGEGVVCMHGVTIGLHNTVLTHNRTVYGGVVNHQHMIMIKHIILFDVYGTPSIDASCCAVLTSCDLLLTIIYLRQTTYGSLMLTPQTCLYT